MTNVNRVLKYVLLFKSFIIKGLSKLRLIVKNNMIFNVNTIFKHLKIPDNKVLNFFIFEVINIKPYVKFIDYIEYLSF